MDGMGRLRKLWALFAGRSWSARSAKCPSCAISLRVKNGFPLAFRGMYARLERMCSSLHAVWHAGGTTEEERSLSFPCDWLCASTAGQLLQGNRGPCPVGDRLPLALPTPGCALLLRLVRQLWTAEPAGADPWLGAAEPRTAVSCSCSGWSISWRTSRSRCRSHSSSGSWQQLALTYRVVPSGPSSCRIVSKLDWPRRPDIHQPPAGRLLSDRRAAADAQAAADVQVSRRAAILGRTGGWSPSGPGRRRAATREQRRFNG